MCSQPPSISLSRYHFYFIAFTKVTKINNTDYEVKLVDTAGQDEYSIFPAQYSMVITTREYLMQSCNIQLIKFFHRTSTDTF